MSKRVPLTTEAGVPVADNQRSQTAGPTGPALLQDHHLIEKLARFNRERIPERVVHAVGTGVYGYLEVTSADVPKWTKMKVFSANGYHDLVTPFFVTENDIARLGTNATTNVTKRFYSGGHMTYLDDSSRALEKADVAQFYQAALAGAAKADTAPARASEPLPATVAPRVSAARMPPAVIEVTVRDPWVPPELRNAARAKSTRGVALDTQVEDKLRAEFAQKAPNGSLTLEEARAAGLGFVAANFDAIDAARRGTVRFEDLKRFLKERGASLPD